MTVHRFVCSIACLAVLLGPGAGRALAPRAPESSASVTDEVWITLDETAFASASRVFPGRADGEPLPRLAEVEGVVLTRVPRAGLALLSEQIHRDLGRCGGFVAHDSLEQALAALDRLRSPAQVEALPFVIDQPAWVALVAGQIDEAQILATMTSLSTLFVNRYHAHPTGTAAANWIRDQWTALAAGRPEVTVELFSHGGITPQPSVILTIPGTTLADEVVVLGGHEDSTRSGCSTNSGCVAPGADDNGSGIAVLSEVIRAAMAADFRPQRTIQFMAYAAEEVGLDGSDDIAATYLAAGTDVVAVLQQDMTDYHGSAEDVTFISDYTNAELNAFLEDLLETYQPTRLWTTDFCGYGCSDHASWHVRGFPASFAFESRFTQSNPAIHTSNDTVGNLGNSAAHAATFARLSAAFLVEAGLDGPALPFSDGFESGDTSAWSATVP